MKTKLNTVLIFLLIFAGFISCEKDKLPPNPVIPPTEETPTDTLDTPENCGCGDIDSIIDHPGTIFYKVPTHTYDTYENNKFWIAHSPMQGFVYRWIVCNEVLPTEIMNLKDTNYAIKKLNILFSGYVKNPCEEPTTIPEHVYYNIVLTKIKIQ